MLFRLAPAALFGSPLLLAVAWWRWWTDDRSRHSQERAALLLIGLSCATAVVAVFWISFGMRWAIGRGSQGAMAVYEGASNLMFYLMLAALVSTVVGKGRGRLLALVATCLNFVLWLPIAF